MNTLVWLIPTKFQLPTLDPARWPYLTIILPQHQLTLQKNILSLREKIIHFWQTYNMVIQYTTSKNPNVCYVLSYALLRYIVPKRLLRFMADKFDLT